MGKNKNWFIESTVEAGEVIINDGGSAVDFRIEGDTDSNLFVTDGSADKVGVGTNAPDTKLHVTSDTVGGLLSVSNHNVSSSMPSEMILQKSRGSKVAPATLADSDEIGKITFKGYDGSSYDELAHIKVASTSVSSDTSKMTFHSDKFILDTGTLQFGTSGQAISAVSTAITAASLDTELVTALAVKTALDAGVDASIVAGELVFTSVTSASNRYKVYFLSDHSSNGTMAASDLKTDGTYFHFGGAADTNFKVKVTGATSLIGATTITGATQVTGALTVGVNDTGHDVKLFGATSGKYMLWDESADSLILGVDDTGVDFIAYGATASKKVHWDESADSLLIHGGAELGQSDTDVLKVHGGFKAFDTNASFSIKAASSSQAVDVFKVHDKEDTKVLWVTNLGFINIEKNLRFNDPAPGNLRSGKFGIGSNGDMALLDFDILGEGGSPSFSINKFGTSKLSIDSSNNFNLNNFTNITAGASTETKFKTAAFKVNSYADSATAGQLEVAVVTTSAGGLTLDSATGETLIKDNLTVAGNITLTSGGSFNLSGTTETSFHIATGGSNVGLKAIDITDSSLPIGVTDFLHPVDSTGNEGTAGIATRYIHSDNSMVISTKDNIDVITIAPGYNVNAGECWIGAAANKKANLTVTGNTTILGNISVSGSVTGTFNLSSTTATEFQFDSTGDGSKINIGADNIIQTVDKDDTANPIHSTGMWLDSAYGASSNLTFKSYNGYMKMQPGTNANTARYLWLEGSIKVRSMGALTYNYIGGMNKIGAEANGSFGTTDDLAAGDTVLYMDNGNMTFDASADITHMTNSSFIFGATDASGSNATDGQVFKLYGNDSSANLEWNQASNLLIVRGTHKDTGSMRINKGLLTIGQTGQDYGGFVSYGTEGTVLSVDSNPNTVTMSKGVITPPQVASNETINLEIHSSSYQFANLAAGHVIYNLPVVATSGQRFKIMVADFTNNLTITCDGSETMVGGVVHLDGGDNGVYDSATTAAAASTASTSVVFTAPYEGTWIELISNGTNWYVTGQLIADASPAFN